MVQIHTNAPVTQNRAEAPQPPPRRTAPPPIAAGKGSVGQQEAARQAEEQARREAQRPQATNEVNRYGLYENTPQFYRQALSGQGGQVVDVKPDANDLEIYKRLQDLTGRRLDRQV